MFKSLTNFVDHEEEEEEERLLCLVRALKCYLLKTEEIDPRPKYLSPHCPTRFLLKNALSFFGRLLLMVMP